MLKNCLTDLAMRAILITMSLAIQPCTNAARSRWKVIRTMEVMTDQTVTKQRQQTFDYTVDDEPQSTSEHTLTPDQILTRAGIDPATHYLVQIIGHTQQSYKDTPNEPIHMHEHMKFVSVFTGGTPVS